jgi:hypothetical protein
MNESSQPVYTLSQHSRSRCAQRSYRKQDLPQTDPPLRHSHRRRGAYDREGRPRSPRRTGIPPGEGGLKERGAMTDRISNEIQQAEAPDSQTRTTRWHTRDHCGR